MCTAFWWAVHCYCFRCSFGQACCRSWRQDVMRNWLASSHSSRHSAAAIWGVRRQKDSGYGLLLILYLFFTHSSLPPSVNFGSCIKEWIWGHEHKYFKYLEQNVSRPLSTGMCFYLCRLANLLNLCTHAHFHCTPNNFHDISACWPSIEQWGASRGTLRSTCCILVCMFTWIMYIISWLYFAHRSNI